MRGERGQATIELVAALPLLVAVALAACQALAAGVARELADHAAEAGAVAALQETDAADAARSSLPGWARSRLAVRVSGGEVRVRLRPPALIPGTSSLLASTATARTTGDR
jgi:anti-sigma factor RsiW